MVVWECFIEKWVGLMETVMVWACYKKGLCWHDSGSPYPYIIEFQMTGFVCLGLLIYKDMERCLIRKESWH